MKRELFWIPFHGWFSHKFGMIPVDRDKGPAALRRMLREAKKRVADGREIIIFPEGTRRAPGAPPDYKTGVVLLYDALGVPCVPVALNSGLFWPRRSVDAPPRHDRRRIPRSNSAGAAQGRVPATGLTTANRRRRQTGSWPKQGATEPPRWAAR